MKNNILLILAVTIISIGIIVATVLISTAGGSDADTSSQPTTSRSSSASVDTKDDTSEPITSAQQTEPSVTSTTSEPQELVIPPESQTHDAEMADSIIATARSLIGIDFIDGGSSPDVGFDNSGLIYYVLRENGYLTCPRGVSAQADMGTALGYDELRPGDLAFFYSEDMSGAGFGGIYCGDGVMIACLMPGTQVKEVDISTNYYKNHFYRGVGIT